MPTATRAAATADLSEPGTAARRPEPPERPAAPAPPLTTLLSHALVAFTIETDNEFEHRMPHRTTSGRTRRAAPGTPPAAASATIRTTDATADVPSASASSDAASPAAGSQRRGPWLVSLAMWETCLRFVPADGIAVRDLEQLARTRTNLAGMTRWGYVRVEPPAGDQQSTNDPRLTKRPDATWIVRLTRDGQRAQAVWRPLPDAIERRWIARFGQAEIDALRAALTTMVAGIDRDLPACLPILGHGLWSRPAGATAAVAATAGGQPAAGATHAPPSDASAPPLSALLSRVLFGLAIVYERRSEISLAIAANVLRVLDAQGIRLRDLPSRTGVSAAAIAMSLGILRKQGLATLVPDAAASRGQVVRLTTAGRAAQEAHVRRLAAIDAGCADRFGRALIDTLRASLTRLAGDGTAARSPLFQGLVPCPDGWRARLRAPETLPHFPMVLHRGGYPDGS